MDYDTKLLCLALLYIRRKRRNRCVKAKEKCIRPKKIWSLQINQRRNIGGGFSKLFHALRTEESKFSDYFKMSISTFDELLYRMGTQIERQDSNMRDAIPPAERLAVALRYLTCGNKMTELHQEFRMGRTTISTIIREVCDAIVRCFSEVCMPPPTVEKFESVAAEFEKKTQFPHCIGAISMKYIRLLHKVEALSLVAVADSDYRFLFVEVNPHGTRDCNSSFFKNTKIFEKITSGRLSVPEPKPLSAYSNKCVPYVFLGNEGFEIYDNIMRPFVDCGTEQKKIFNSRLNKAREYVDRAFAILSNKWGIFHRPSNSGMEIAMKVVKACCVLHNFVGEREGFKFEDVNTGTGLRDVINAESHYVREGFETRQMFADYFVNDKGSVPWQ